MMIGVAQVIGTKPIANSFFSSGPVLSTASALAAPSGNTLDSEDSTAPAPRLRKSSRRVVPTGNTLRSTATSTRCSMADSAATDGAPSNHASCSFKQPPTKMRGRWVGSCKSETKPAYPAAPGLRRREVLESLGTPPLGEVVLNALVGFSRDSYKFVASGRRRETGKRALHRGRGLGAMGGILPICRNLEPPTTSSSLLPKDPPRRPHRVEHRRGAEEDLGSDKGHDPKEREVHQAAFGKAFSDRHPSQLFHVLGTPFSPSFLDNSNPLASNS